MSDSGLGQFLDFGAGSITVSVGKVTSVTVPNASGAQHQEGIGANDDVVGGLLAPGGSAEFMCANADLLAYALRSGFTSPSFTALNFAGGFVGDGRQHTGCNINTLRLRGAIDAPLMASIEWLGLADAAYATAAKTALTDTVLQGYSGVVTIGNASLQCTGFEVALNNNLSHVYTMDSATTNSQRLPDAIHIGSQNVTLSVDVLTRPNSTEMSDILADTIAADIGATFVYTGGTGGSETFTITLASMSRFTRPVTAAAGGGITTYTMTLEAKNDASGVIAITCQ